MRTLRPVVALDLGLGHLRSPSGASPVGGSPEGSRAAAGHLGLQRRQLGVDVRRRRRPCRVGPGCRRSGLREVGQRPRGEQFVERAAARLHLGDLVLGALHRGAGVAHRGRDAADGFGDVRGGLGGGVGGLDGLLLRAEGLDLGLERLGGRR